MKKIFLIALAALFMLPMGMEAKKPKMKLTATVELDSQHEGIAKKVEFRINDYMFSNSCYIEGFRVWNATGERIYIQWEDARLLGGKVCFEGDTPLNYMNPKADESVFNYKFSIDRRLFSAKMINSSTNSLYPMYDAKKLKKDGGSRTINLDLPVKFSDNHVELYKVKIIYRAVPVEDK